MRQIKNYINKSDLIIGRKYKGTCRNAEEAVWVGKYFIYERCKFGDKYHESINHPEDDNGFDLFYPQELLEDKYIEKHNLKIGKWYKGFGAAEEAMWLGNLFMYDRYCYGREKEEIEAFYPGENKESIFIPYEEIK